MKRWIFTFILFTLMSLSCGEVSEARRREIPNELLGNSLLNVQDYPSQEKEWIQNWILDVGKNSPGMTSDSFDLQLLQLGHRPTVAKYGKIVMEGGNSPYLSRSNQPRLIPYFESRLQTVEPAGAPQSGDTTGWRESVSAAGMILHFLSESSELSGDVRRWARELLKELDHLGSDNPKARKGLDEGRAIVREWWTVNKATIVAERFADVKSGRVHSFTFDKQPKPEPITPAKSVLKRRDPLPEDSESPKTAQGIAEAPPEGSNWFWIVPAVCVALGIGLFAAFRKKG